MCIHLLGGLRIYWALRDVCLLYKKKRKFTLLLWIACVPKDFMFGILILMHGMQDTNPLPSKLYLKCIFQTCPRQWQAYKIFARFQPGQMDLLALCIIMLLSRITVALIDKPVTHQGGGKTRQYILTACSRSVQRE